VLGLVALAHYAGAYPVLDELLHVGDVEVVPEAVQGTLDTLVPILMCSLDDLPS
jgi:hypothetical protein